MNTTRRLALWLFTLLTATACAGEQSLAPRSAANAALAAPTVTSQTVAVGDEVLIWASWSIPEGSEIDAVLNGRIDLGGTPFCSGATYFYDAAIQQKSASGSTHFPGAEKLQSADVFPNGTRLRYLRYVASCDGAYNAYAFEVISLPGR